LGNSSSLDILIRHPDPEDFFEITNLHRSAADNLLKQRGFDQTSPFTSNKLPPVPPAGPFPWFDNGLKEHRDGFWVAEADSSIVGFTLSWVQGSLWFLAQLFVSPNYQGHGIGNKLMERTMQYRRESEITNRALVTFAYNPFSITLYSRFGIYPREPLYYMDVPREKVNKLNTATELKHEPITDFQSARKILTGIDERCIGYPREKNHEYLFNQPTVKCYLFRVHSEPVGYAFVSQTGRIGPISSVSEVHFTDIVNSSLVQAAQSAAPTLGMAVTGSNERLVKLAFASGMKIRDNFLLMSAKPFPNLFNYVLFPTGAML
jgi:GNAT superfamily N-acetyltransferase